MKKKKKPDRRKEGDYNIRIRQRALKCDYAQIEPHSNGHWNFSIWIHWNLDPWTKAVKLFHELLHFLVYRYIPFNNEKMEHDFIEAMEKDLEKNLSKYWRKK